MRIMYHNTIKHQQYQHDMGCAFGKSKHNQDVTINMMSTDILAFSEMIETHYPTIEAYVLHVRAHERQAGEGNSPRMSFTEFKQQEDALFRRNKHASWLI